MWASRALGDERVRDGPGGERRRPRILTQGWCPNPGLDIRSPRNLASMHLLGPLYKGDNDCVDDRVGRCAYKVRKVSASPFGNAARGPLANHVARGSREKGRRRKPSPTMCQRGPEIPQDRSALPLQSPCLSLEETKETNSKMHGILRSRDPRMPTPLYAGVLTSRILGPKVVPLPILTLISVLAPSTQISGSAWLYTWFLNSRTRRKDVGELHGVRFPSVGLRHSDGASQCRLPKGQAQDQGSLVKWVILEARGHCQGHRTGHHPSGPGGTLALTSGASRSTDEKRHPGAPGTADSGPHRVCCRGGGDC